MCGADYINTHKDKWYTISFKHMLKVILLLGIIRSKILFLNLTLNLRT